jgi:hypothetical protein
VALWEGSTPSYLDAITHVRPLSGIARTEQAPAKIKLLAHDSLVSQNTYLIQLGLLQKSGQEKESGPQYGGIPQDSYGLRLTSQMPRA